MGIVESPADIINEIVERMPFSVSEIQKKKLIDLRKERMRSALINIENEIIETIQKLHDNGVKIGLISNADIVDAMFWNESPLYNLFNDAVFSYKVKCLKPDFDIYDIATKRMNVSPEKSLFVGDGGSDELLGARRVGMKTVFTEYLGIKELKKRKKIMEYSDYHIIRFSELVRLIL
jgi:putative hydrolase of the HAD superfamily